MPPQSDQDLVATAWTTSAAGRQYRTLNIRGRQYTQWDHEQGQCIEVTNATPRTPNPQNQSIARGPTGLNPREIRQQHANYLQPDPAYQNPLFGAPTRSSSTSVPVPQHRESEGSLYNRQHRRANTDHQIPRTDDDLEDRHYAVRSTNTPYTDGNDTEGDAMGARTRSNRANGPLVSKPSSGHARKEEKEPEPSGLERSKTYPEGYRRVMYEGRVCYVDDKNNIILPHTTKRDAQTVSRTSSLDAVTSGVSRLGIEGQERNNRLLPTDHHPTPDAVDISHAVPAGTVGRRPSTTHKPSLPTVREDKKLNSTRIKAGTTPDDLLDKRYFLRQGRDMQKFYHPGRVLAMLWHESAGSTGTALSNGKPRAYIEGKYKVQIYSTIRRMVVVRVFHGYSWCIPIHTYNGQGVTKKGLSPEEVAKHTIIYINGTTPHPLPQEHLVKVPIAVDPASLDQKLDPKSRLNFGKLYTVEHNIRAMNVGVVAKASTPYLLSYFENVCNAR